MEFNDNKPIYRQIVDYAFNSILNGMWLPGSMVPSVRELTGELGVNNRTVLRAFDELQDMEVIESKRGMGFMLRADAKEKVRSVKRREFLEVTLPAIIAEMKALGINSEELAAMLSKMY